MILELLVNMESPNTPGKEWRAGQLIDVTEAYANQLIEEGKAKKYEAPPPVAKEAPKKGKK